MLFFIYQCIGAPALLQRTHASKRWYFQATMPTDCATARKAYMMDVKSGRQSIATENANWELADSHRDVLEHVPNMCKWDISIPHCKINGMLTQYAWSQNTVPKFPATKRKAEFIACMLKRYTCLVMQPYRQSSSQKTVMRNCSLNWQLQCLAACPWKASHADKLCSSLKTVHIYTVQSSNYCKIYHIYIYIYAILRIYTISQLIQSAPWCSRIISIVYPNKAVLNTDDTDDAGKNNATYQWCCWCQKQQCGLPMMLMMPKTSPLELKKVR